MNLSTKIAVPNEKGFSFVDQSSILYGLANGHHTKLHFENGHHIETTKNLKEVIALLSKDLFVRVHHSHFISLQHLKTYINEGQCMAEMSDGTWLNVSRSRRRDLMERFVRM